MEEINEAAKKSTPKKKAAKPAAKKETAKPAAKKKPVKKTVAKEDESNHVKKEEVKKETSKQETEVKKETKKTSAKKTTEKKRFHKDTLFDKVDFYPLFSSFLEFVYIDTIAVNSGSFSNYTNISSKRAQTSIANFEIEVYDLLIDSVSATDPSRILYAKDLIMNLYGFKSHLKDSIHVMTADYVVATTIQNGITAHSIKLKPESTQYLSLIHISEPTRPY